MKHSLVLNFIPYLPNPAQNTSKKEVWFHSEQRCIWPHHNLET